MGDAAGPTLGPAHTAPRRDVTARGWRFGRVLPLKRNSCSRRSRAGAAVVTPSATGSEHPRAPSRFSRFAIPNIENRLVASRFRGLMLTKGENRLVASRFSALMLTKGENRFAAPPRRPRRAERDPTNPARIGTRGALRPRPTRDRAPRTAQVDSAVLTTRPLSAPPPPGPVRPPPRTLRARCRPGSAGLPAALSSLDCRPRPRARTGRREQRVGFTLAP